MTTLHCGVAAATVRAPMPRHKTLSGSLVAAAIAASGATQAQVQIDHSAEYDACMLLAGRAPTEALASARSWEEAGGGNPARHCAAIALFNLRNYEEAAGRLEALAEEIGAVDLTLTAGLHDQAGRAWLLAGEPGAAMVALESAIALTPQDAELYIARSYAHAAQRDYVAALQDLNQAESLAPGLAEIHLLKAAALRFHGNAAAALEEADRAAAAAPADPDVYLERGNIRWILEDFEGAASDWGQVLSLAPDSAAAQAARRNLARLP